MTDEINKILEADETAWEKVLAARAEAEAIRSHALSRAEEIASERKRELSASSDAERERILAEAHSRAGQTIEEANHYIDSLQQKKSALLDQLVDNLLKRVTGT